MGLPVGFVAWLVAVLVHGAGIPSPIAGVFGIAMLSAASATIIERGVVERIDHWTEATDATEATEARPAHPGVASILVLVFATIVRAVAIVMIPASEWLLVFLATAVVGRWAAVFLQALGDPVPEDRGRRSLVATPSPAWLTVAISAGVAALAILALGKAAIVALALAAIASFSLGLEAQRRDGGLSAPVVATAAAIGELLVLLIATIGH
ncbi:MAG: hypothetical protein H6Q90_1504 [Deltaproteobacteria bacterium]|nr:hypothetical protein [Deltaproteobacteria bacterium]